MITTNINLSEVLESEPCNWFYQCIITGEWFKFYSSNQVDVNVPTLIQTLINLEVVSKYMCFSHEPDALETNCDPMLTISIENRTNMLPDFMHHMRQRTTE